MAQDLTIRIGSAQENDVVLADKSVSRRHAHVTFTSAGRIVLEDGLLR